MRKNYGVKVWMYPMPVLIIAAYIDPLLPHIRTHGCDIVDVDWMVDFAKANQILSGVSAVSGNIDPVTSVLHSTPDCIQREVHRLLDATDATSIINGGCEIPKKTSPSVLHTMDQALWEYDYSKSSLN